MRRGFTIVEISVAVGVCALLISTLYAFMSRIFSSNQPSVSRSTAASFVRQDVRLTFEKLMARLEEGIEVLAPAPGETAAELDFKDVLNHHTRLALDAGGNLVTYRVENGTATVETAAKTVAVPGAAPYTVAMPVKVPGVKKVRFAALTPTLVSVALTLSDGQTSGTLVASARLRNFRQVTP